jgi:anti-sigma B factor antagonist
MTFFDRAGTLPPVQRVVTVALPGEVDLLNAGEVRDSLAVALESGAVVVIADAGETTFCDCAGVRALILAQRQAAASGSCLRVAVASRSVRRAFELTGADQVLAIYPNAGAAAEPACEQTAALTGQRHEREEMPHDRA